MTRTAAIIAAIAIIASGFALWAFSGRDTLPTQELMDQQQFGCYAVSESMRTIGHARHRRKQGQIARIERLLTHELEALDAAKLRSELAILRWESENTRRQRDCAEAWYEPGSTRLRETFDQPDPPPIDYAPIQEAFQEVVDQVPERLRPHGFAERAALHLGEAALATGDLEKAIEHTQGFLEIEPRSLYTDGLKLTLADALLQRSERTRALTLYRDVGKLRLGIEAQYARYRAAAILRNDGQSAEADQLLKEVRIWAERSGRDPIVKVLSPQED